MSFETLVIRLESSNDHDTSLDGCKIWVKGNKLWYMGPNIDKPRLVVDCAGKPIKCKSEVSCDICKDRKPGEYIETTDDLRCVHCGEAIKFTVPPLEKSIPNDMLKAAEILDKKADINRRIMASNCLNKEGKDFWNTQASTFEVIAKALRGEE